MSSSVRRGMTNLNALVSSPSNAQLPSIAQIKYKNLMAMENRLNLYESFKLNQKILLDRPALQALRTELKRNNSQTDRISCDWTNSIKVMRKITVLQGMPDYSVESDRTVPCCTYLLSCSNYCQVIYKPWLKSSSKNNCHAGFIVRLSPCYSPTPILLMYL